MNITLTSEHKQFIDEKIKSGCYNSINEVIGDSLRLLDERGSIKSMQPDELRLELDLGVEKVRNAESITETQEERLRLITAEIASRNQTKSKY